jgi:hypothetical protein
MLPPRIFKRLDMMESPKPVPIVYGSRKAWPAIRLEYVPETLRVDTNPTVRDDDLETDSPVLMVDHPSSAESSSPIENCEAWSLYSRS